MKRVLGNKSLSTGFKTIEPEFFTDNEIIRMSSVFFFSKNEQDVLMKIMECPNISIDEIFEENKKIEKDQIAMAISNLIRAGYIQQHYMVNYNLIEFTYIHVDCKKNPNTLLFIENNRNILHSVISKNRILMTIAVRGTSALIEFQNKLKEIDKSAIFEEVQLQDKAFSLW